MRTLFFLISMCAWAHGLERPVLGYIRDAEGAWHAVEGTSGAFVVGPATDEDHGFVTASDLTLEHRENGFYILDRDGATVDILPPEATCATLLNRGALYATDQELVLGTLRYALSRVTALRAISAEYVQVSTTDGEFLLRVEAGREALFQLPVIPVTDAVAEEAQ